MNVRIHRCSVANRASDLSAHVLGKSRRNRGSNPEGVESPGRVAISLLNRHATPFLRNRQRSLFSAHRLSVAAVKSSICQSTQRCLGVLAQLFFSQVQIQNANSFPSFRQSGATGREG